MTIQYRPIAMSELEQFSRAQALAFGHPFHADALEHRAANFEAERSTAAFDGERLVGTSGVFTFDMTVPGGVTPVAGVTMVSVQPTDRRRGILTGMMDVQLRGIQARGEAVAALWASEAPIYERFGYGMASQNADLSIERVHARIRHDVPSSGSVRLVSAAEAAAVLPPVYDRTRVGIPGFYSHTKNWWEHRVLQDPEWGRNGASEHRYAVYREGERELGYVIYRTKPDYSEWVAKGQLIVLALIAETPAAYSALWRYVFGSTSSARSRRPNGARRSRSTSCWRTRAG
ncbi:MAG: GNAT family N-acetyltransferase [Dehalococcoidia bacterium]|nr:GNAT family N-acetyltransferase [Dehalococcoidia bacterium]